MKAIKTKKYCFHSTRYLPHLAIRLFNHSWKPTANMLRKKQKSYKTPISFSIVETPKMQHSFLTISLPSSFLHFNTHITYLTSSEWATTATTFSVPNFRDSTFRYGNPFHSKYKLHYKM